MNVLVHGATNVIAIGAARVLHRAGHRVFLSDTSKYNRAFFSKYCSGEKILKDPLEDWSSFEIGLSHYLEREDIRFIVPTTDKALLELVQAKDAIPEKVSTSLMQLDREKICYVLNKKNLPKICCSIHVKTPLTFPASRFQHPADAGFMTPPVVVKPAKGLAGEGFVKVYDSKSLGRVLINATKNYFVDDLLVQEFIQGKVYGAGGVFDGHQLESFYSYELINRHPSESGSPTVCRYRELTQLKELMTRVLTSLDWHGFCQMDFIVEQKTGEAYLIDINPTHWYTMPFSSSESINSLLFCLGEKIQQQKPKNRPYTTICLTGELQRILSWKTYRLSSSGWKYPWWQDYQGLRRNDFFWDPWPIILVPFIKLFKSSPVKDRIFSK